MAGLIAGGMLSLSWCLLAIWLGPRIGFVDNPDSALKVHERAAVPLGGVGVFAGYHFAVALNGAFDLAVFVSTSIVLVLGLVDDRRGLSPSVRLVAETAAGIVLAVGLVGLDSPITSAAVVLLVVFAINAVNLFDGLDGLAASCALISSLGIAALGGVRSLGLLDQPMALALALVGFLILGWHPARVFLGDSGSYVIGVLLASATVGVSPAGNAEFVLASAVLGVFAIDLIVTIVRRRRAGHPLFEGDRSHLYDQLRDYGMSVPRVVYVAVGAQLTLLAAVVGVAAWLPPLGGIAVIGMLWLLVLAVVLSRRYPGPGAF